MIKNTFYVSLKALFFLKIFNSFLTFWSNRKNGLIRMVRLYSKFMTSQPGYEAFIILILRNVLRSKGNHTMKFGHLIEILEILE